MGTAVGLIIDAPHLLILRFHNAETTGRIVRVIPNSHGLTEISYSVRGTPYTRDVPFYWVSEHLQSEQLRIYYDPNDPTLASAAPADEILKGQIPAWIAFSALGSLWGAIAATGIMEHWGARKTR